MGASVTVMTGLIFSPQALVDLAVYQNYCISKLPSSPNNLSHKNQIWDQICIQILEMKVAMITPKWPISSLNSAP